MPALPVLSPWRMNVALIGIARSLARPRGAILRSKSNSDQAPAAARHRGPSLKYLFADGAYDRTRLMDAAAYRDFILEIVRRTDKEPGFKVLPRRWGVERTFGWMTRWKRLVRDYEQRLDVSEAMIHVALGSLMLRRIVHP
jgi:transposase